MSQHSFERQSVCRFLPVAISLLMTATSHAEFTPVVGFDNQLFPSFIIATASVKREPAPNEAKRLGDPQGLIGIRVAAPSDECPVRLTVECEEYLEKTVYTTVLPVAGEEYHISPIIKYRYEKLAKCEQAAPISLTIRLQLGEDAEEETTTTVIMHSVNDCPFLLREGDEVVDISFAFAAYVNEQHPFVDKLLREALDIGVVRAFTGYQEGEQGVLRQAYALWDLLVARDIRYSSITNTAVSSENVACQHVRMIEDSINNSQANCVDGAVLWVSLMRKIGIESFLVIEPTHCYAGFYADREQKKVYAVETTLLGQAFSMDSVSAPEDIHAAIPEEVRGDSFASFCAAIQTAGASLQTAINKKETGETDVRFIDIAAARRMGILPVAFQNKEGFVWRELPSLTAEEVPADEDLSADEESQVNEATDESETTEYVVDNSDDYRDYEADAEDEVDAVDDSEDEGEYDDEEGDAVEEDSYDEDDEHSTDEDVDTDS